jgi:hypothetical protein
VASLQIWSGIPITELYHYTGWSGFEGIVKTGEVWATNARFTNDETELLHGLELARDELLGLTTENSKVQDEAIKNVLNALPGPIFVACFSTQRDDPHQWCEYNRANPERDGSFCLAFDMERVRHAHALLVPCSYREDEKRSFVRTLLTDVPWAPDHFAKGGTAQEEFAGLMSHVLAAMKEEKWSRECEFRLMYRPGDRADTLPEFAAPGHDDARVPRVAIPLRVDGDRLPLVEVIVNARSDTDAVRDEAKGFLTMYGYEDVPVNPSKWPLTTLLHT